MVSTDVLIVSFLSRMESFAGILLRTLISPGPGRLRQFRMMAITPIASDFRHR